MAGLCICSLSKGLHSQAHKASVEGDVDVALNTLPEHSESRCSRDAPLSHVTPSPKIIPQSSRQLLRHHPGQEGNACRNPQESSHDHHSFEIRPESNV